MAVLLRDRFLRSLSVAGLLIAAAVTGVLVLAIAAAEAAVGLAILLAVYRRWRSTRVSDMRLLKG